MTENVTWKPPLNTVSLAVDDLTNKENRPINELTTQDEPLRRFIRNMLKETNGHTITDNKVNSGIMPITSVFQPTMKTAYAKNKLSSKRLSLDSAVGQASNEHLNEAFTMSPENSKDVVFAYKRRTSICLNSRKNSLNEVGVDTAITENNTQKQKHRYTRRSTSIDISSLQAHRGYINRAYAKIPEVVISTDVVVAYKRRTSISLNARNNSLLNDNVDKIIDDKISSKNLYIHDPEELIDSKFAWVVACSACLIGIILGGLSWSFGLLFKELLKYYDESRNFISLTQSAQNGTFLFIGPFTGYFISKFDCRKVGITGSVILSTALLASSFAPSVYALIVLYGLIGGIGYGLLYTPSITVVGQYFEKRRALATSIVCCGSSVGGLVFAPLMNFLLDRYGWRGSMMILSAICLNGIALSAVFRPFILVLEQLPGIKTKITPASYESDTKEKPTDLIFTIKDTDEESPDKGFIRDTDEKSPDTGVTIGDNNEKSTELGFTVINIDKKSPDIGFTISDTDENITDKKETEHEDREGSCFKVMMGLLKDPAFLCFSASGFLGMFSFYVPLMYIPQLADSVGMSSSRGQFFVSAISLSNTISRVLIGLSLDRKLIDPALLFGGLMVIGGVATMCLKYFTSVSLMMMYSVVFGSSGAAFITLRSIILANLFGAYMLPYTFGLAIMFQGIAAFVGPPAIGAIIDATGNFVLSFFIAGVFLFLSGCLAFLMRRTKRWLDVAK